MTISLDPIPGLALSAAAGAVLGVVYFGGLWMTLRLLQQVRSPALLVFGSFLARSLVVVAGFLVVAGPHWQRLVAILVGFLVARLILTRVWGPDHQPSGPLLSKGDSE